jgi:hypothetical protein
MPDATMTMFEYRYRDASNYKASGRILLNGKMSDADHALYQVPRTVTHAPMIAFRWT